MARSGSRAWKRLPSTPSTRREAPTNSINQWRIAASRCRGPRMSRPRPAAPLRGCPPLMRGLSCLPRRKHSAHGASTPDGRGYGGREAEWTASRSCSGVPRCRPLRSSAGFFRVVGLPLIPDTISRADAEPPALISGNLAAFLRTQLLDLGLVGTKEGLAERRVEVFPSLNDNPAVVLDEEIPLLRLPIHRQQTVQDGGVRQPLPQLLGGEARQHLVQGCPHPGEKPQLVGAQIVIGGLHGSAGRHEATHV